MINFKCVIVFNKTMNKESSSLLDAIGNTPLIALNNLNNNSKIEILGKFEGSNPGGSVKDRPAYYMIKEAENSGELNENKIIIEATSGNTGIALAMIGKVKGYRVKLVMPECVSTERHRTLEAFDAEIVLTPAEKGTDGAIEKAHEILNKTPDKHYMPNQYENENNPLSHYETTGPEIFSQTNGEVDVFVAGMGTGGTLMGTGKYLKEKKPEIKVVGIEPKKNHKIQGLKNMEEAVTPGIYNPEMLDKKLIIGDEEAFKTARLLAVKEGLFVGMSSGAAVAGALRVAKNMDSGTIVTILPDRGDRYLSTTLFRSVCGECPP